jgi:ATP-dependent protease ClpP protease subunit
LVKNTKLTKKKLTKMLNEKVNVYLSAEEAVELGIADIII